MSKRQEAELGVGGSAATTVRLDTRSSELPSVLSLIEDLQDRNTRDRALEILSSDRSIRGELAPYLWNSFGTIASLLQEIISVYVSLHSPQLTGQKLSRVCNALALLQCVATHPDTKMLFLEAKIQCYLYPFLSNTCTARPQQYIRLSSLGVIGALVKSDDAEVVTLLLETQLFPSCLTSMEVGDNMSKTVATFILQKVLQSDMGLKYCCSMAERFYAIAGVLGNMVEKLSEDGDLAEASRIKLLKRIVWCYLKLSEHPRACEGLRRFLPSKLMDASFIGVLQEDEMASQCLQGLFSNLTTSYISKAPHATQSRTYLNKPPVPPLLSPSRQPARDLLEYLSRR